MPSEKIRDEMHDNLHFPAVSASRMAALICGE